MTHLTFSDFRRNIIRAIALGYEVHYNLDILTVTVASDYVALHMPNGLDIKIDDTTPITVRNHRFIVNDVPYYLVPKILPTFNFDSEC